MPTRRTSSRPFKLGWTEDGLLYETWGSYATAEGAERGRDRYIAGIAADRHTYRYCGWWVVLDVDRAVVSSLGFGGAEGKPLPQFSVVRTKAVS